MQFGTDCSTVYTSPTYQRRVTRLFSRKRCKHLPGSGVYTSRDRPFSYQVKNLQTLTLYGSGEIFERRKTCSDPPFVYTGPVETKTMSQFQEIHLHLAYLASCNEREGMRNHFTNRAVFVSKPSCYKKWERRVCGPSLYSEREFFFSYLLYDATR